VESLIYVNTETVTAHCTPTGNGPPRVICTLLAQWQARFSFFVTGEDPAAVAGTTLRCVLKEVPTGAVLLASTTATLSAAVYTFDFASVDSSGLRTLIGDADQIELQGEVEWTLSGRVERVYFPVTVLNSRHRPDDGAPDPADSASNAWLSARAVRFDEAQTLTTEQKAQARTNIGVTSGVSDHGALTGLADDDHTQYFNQTRGDARYPLASTMTSALAGKEPLQTLATQAEMEAGTVTDPRRMSPKLVADAIAALSSGGPGIDLPVAIADGGTGVTTAQAARVALGVEEIVDAVAREVVVSFSEDLAAAWGGASFDLSNTTQVVRIWFEDGVASPPDTPSGGRLIGVGWYGDAIQQGNELAAVLEADAAFTASSPATNGTVNIANSTAGECVAPYEAPTNAYISGSLVTEGVDAYQRMTALDGRELTNVNATTIPAPTSSTLGGVRSTAAGSGLYLRSLDTNGNFTLGLLPVSDVKYYTSNATWTNPFPSTPRRVFVRLVGGGGGGGSGRKGALNDPRFGGGGAGGGAVTEFWTLTTELGATASVVIGAGGTGGTAISADSTNGNNGTNGGDTTFAGATAAGGTLGAGGGSSSGTAGAALSNSCISGVSVAASSPGGAGGAVAGAASNGSLSALPTGGGGGGGHDAANTNRAGGAGGPMGAGVMVSLAGGTAGTAGGGNGGNGNAGRGTGTGGGGGGSNNAGAGGRGGNGGGFGSGGGGGAAGTNSIGSSGAGGNGRPGYALIITY
jgi:hypothetical protein